MRDRDDQFVRLLRWYPKAWRDAHGAVFLDTLREQSEHEGTSRPSRSESFAALVNGLGARLDARLGARMTLAGIALTAALHLIGVLSAAMGLYEPVPFEPVRDALFLAASGGIAMLVLVGIIALALTYGLLSAGRAVGVLTLALPALALATVAVYLWALSFRLPDENLVLNGLAAAWLPMAAVAAVPGIVATALFVEGLLTRTRLGRLPRYALSALLSVAVAPFGAYAVNFPMGWVAVAVGVVVLFMRSLGPTELPEPVPAAKPRGSRWVRPLARTSMALGVIGIIYALTASLWSSAAPNGEVAVRQGAILLMVATIPVMAAMGILASGQGRPALHVWGPVITLIAGIGIMIFAFRFSSNMGSIDPTVFVASAVLGTAIGWWSAAPLQAARVERWVAGVSIALACLAFQGAYLIPYAASLAPVAAAVIAIRGHLGRRRAAIPTQDPVANA